MAGAIARRVRAGVVALLWVLAAAAVGLLILYGAAGAGDGPLAAAVRAASAEVHSLALLWLIGLLAALARWLARR